MSRPNWHDALLELLFKLGNGMIDIANTMPITAVQPGDMIHVKNDPDVSGIVIIDNILIKEKDYVDSVSAGDLIGNNAALVWLVVKALKPNYKYGCQLFDPSISAMCRDCKGAIRMLDNKGDMQCSCWHLITRHTCESGYYIVRRENADVVG